MVEEASVGVERLVMVPKLRLFALIEQFGVTVALAVRESGDCCPPPIFEVHVCCELILGL